MLPPFSSARDIVLACLLVVAVQQLASAAYIFAKAQLAQVLIARAWSQSLEDEGRPVKPWPWADTWPVAKLSSEQHAQDLYVLAGASGHALAFGPGHESSSALPGETGIAVIGGHRDTHFAFLQELSPGAALEVQQPSGEWVRFRVSATEVVDSEQQPLTIAAAGEPELLLVTCYPFHSLITDGPMRYLVHAQKQFNDSVDVIPATETLAL